MRKQLRREGRYDAVRAVYRQRNSRNRNPIQIRRIPLILQLPTNTCCTSQRRLRTWVLTATNLKFQYRNYRGIIHNALVKHILFPTPRGVTEVKTNGLSS